MLIRHILSTMSQVSMYLVRNSKFCFVIGFTEISILKLTKTGWFQTSTQNTLHAILYWVNEQNEQVHSKKFFVWLKFDLIQFFICDLCYKFWFSRPASNVLSPAFNWAKWVKWVTQGQELNISLWNWFHWIQCLRIGLRDISYF